MFFTLKSSVYFIVDIPQLSHWSFFASFSAGCLSARWWSDRLMIAQGWGGRRRVLWFNTTCALPLEIKMIHLHQQAGLVTSTWVWADEVTRTRLLSVGGPTSPNSPPLPPPVISSPLDTGSNPINFQKGCWNPVEQLMPIPFMAIEMGKCALGIHKHFFLFNSKLVQGRVNHKSGAAKCVLTNLPLVFIGRRIVRPFQ